ncbi:MAG TPA: hypothetical protein VGR23_06220 [Candidatus Dormibacteraeota bacterium]|nr:hypothetical protein [Candidatus Dormibacteraeota bacterium]
MTLAELHGKLSPETVDDRLEDLLTSDVFGTMRYAGWDVGFGSWMKTARSPSKWATASPRISELLPDTITDVHYTFWPRLPNGREPDVGLLLPHPEGDATLVVVEVKYLSGASNSTIAGGDDPKLTGNQLGDQIRGTAALTRATAVRWFGVNFQSFRARLHLLVTKDAVLPQWLYDEASAHVPPTQVHPYWLSWTTLTEHLSSVQSFADAGRAALVKDLIDLLQAKELTRYRGFGSRLWSGLSTTEGFWRGRWWTAPPMQHLSPRGFWLDKYWASALPSPPRVRSFWRNTPP